MVPEGRYHETHDYLFGGIALGWRLGLDMNINLGRHMLAHDAAEMSICCMD